MNSFALPAWRKATSKSRSLVARFHRAGDLRCYRPPVARRRRHPSGPRATFRPAAHRVFSPFVGYSKRDSPCQELRWSKVSWVYSPFSSTIETCFECLAPFRSQFRWRGTFPTPRHYRSQPRMTNTCWIASTAFGPTRGVRWRLYCTQFRVHIQQGQAVGGRFELSMRRLAGKHSWFCSGLDAAHIRSQRGFVTLGDSQRREPEWRWFAHKTTAGRT